MKPTRRPLTLARAALLGAALLLAQWLGHAHAVAHAAGSGGVPLQAEHRHVHAHATDGHGHVAAIAEAVGGEHAAGDAACRLVDQLTHADLLFAAPAVAALLTAPADAAAPRTAPCRGQAPGAAYQPRAPPARG